MIRNGETIWIIGGSSGIGAALAEAFARAGAGVVISGRDPKALAKTVDKYGPALIAAQADATDVASLEAVADQYGPFDRVITTAAIYDPGPVLKADQNKAEAIFSVNLTGTFNVARVGAKALKPGGQLVLFGSAAAIFGLPNGQAYSATKAATVNLAQSLRAELWPQVDVRLVTPGFVRTPLTDQNQFSMPGLMEPEDAAKRIMAGLATKRFEIAFPRRLIWPLKVLGVLPHPLAFAITARMRG
ncbi:SDR family NAD(P)-dependent oxidoreductase [Devosia sp. XJ19-1]|uniref:SDR family NAD(P)-dependent oxidoreductase n=1 Tax=Devosia ureilytica TaxID=2952754 RepID=A0A9Q4ALN0_9HYPH|nr:SDR family NAD(P)-dependent oxidoreductase [Devosia ureilytica]MCP8883293.1 SDR family NAD(P)-dependent oxidoreductase [Devosia ureilytica]MCP8886339.1 SDR family NAD(P)-dependent oxidoreductase [Devosia ureilytica]